MLDAQRISNAPCFNRSGRSGGFQEVWYMKLNDPETSRALWLRFTVLVRNDASKAIAEVWAIFFDSSKGATRKTGLKNTWPLGEFSTVGDAGLRIANSCLLPDHTEGNVQNDQHHLQWSFDIAPVAEFQFDFVPTLLTRFKLVKNMAVTVHEHIAFTGWCEVDGVRYKWQNAPAMQGHLAGPRNGHSWAWGHCNSFTDASGAPAPVIWDGLCARAALGSFAAPPLTSLFFRIGEAAYHINTLRDAMRTRASYDFSNFRFHAVKDRVVFDGEVSARLSDYAGVTYEDTDGSHLYCHNSKISDMTLTVTQPNGEQQIYTSTGAVAYEVVNRNPHPDIPLII